MKVKKGDRVIVLSGKDVGKEGEITRVIPERRDRLATIIAAPFMTCSARLPVYTLIIAAFIPERPLLGGLFGTRAASMLGLYFLGFAAAILTARLLKSSILKSERAPFVMEMPPYRMPTMRSIGLRLFDRAMAFLKRAGTVILLVSIVLWVLASVPMSKPGAYRPSIRACDRRADGPGSAGRRRDGISRPRSRRRVEAGDDLGGRVALQVSA